MGVFCKVARLFYFLLRCLVLSLALSTVLSACDNIIGHRSWRAIIAYVMAQPVGPTLAKPSFFQIARTAMRMQCLFPSLSPRKRVCVMPHERRYLLIAEHRCTAASRRLWLVRVTEFP